MRQTESGQQRLYGSGCGKLTQKAKLGSIKIAAVGSAEGMEAIGYIKRRGTYERTGNQSGQAAVCQGYFYPKPVGIAKLRKLLRES